jgi:uncharacterized protein YheU (UPF0270 family)
MSVMDRAHDSSLRIPYDELSPDALRGVVESFVLREGTDYGAREFSLEEKVSQVMDQLRRGEAHVVFDPQAQSVSIVLTAEPASDRLARR